MPPAINPGPSVVALVPARSGSKRLAHKNIRPLRAIRSSPTRSAPRARRACSTRSWSRRIRRRTPTSRAITAPRCRSCARPRSSADTVAGHRLGRAHHAGAWRPRAGATTPSRSFARHRPSASPRPSGAPGDRFAAATRHRSLARRRAGRAASRQDVGRARRSHACRCCRSRRRTKPWHSQQKAALPEVYVQNASLEIAWTRMVARDALDRRHRARALLHRGRRGRRHQRGRKDWWYAEHLIARGEAVLPPIDREPYPLDRLPPGAR